MKSAAFDYLAPTSIDEAVAALAEHGDESKVLAGGQSLMPLLVLRLARPSVLIDVGRVEDLATINANGVLRLGAMVTQRTAERSAAVAQRCPLLTDALPLIAHRPIRTRGTIGGSLAHGDPAAELPAVALALEAELVVKGPAGERTIAAADFFRGYLTTALEFDELLYEVRFPASAPGSGHAFVEVSRRHGDFALVGCAAVLAFDAAGNVSDARLAFSGVDSTPIRTAGAEELLRDAQPSAELWAEAGAQASTEVEPGSDLHASAAYRRHITGVLARRALTAAAANANTATTTHGTGNGTGNGSGGSQ